MMTSSISMANSDDGRLYLSTPYNTSVPGMLLNLDPNDSANGEISLYEDILFPEGTKFVDAGMFTVANYGNGDNKALLPLAFVNPILSNGEVDTSITLGFPYHFFYEQNTQLKLSKRNRPEINESIAAGYNNTGKSFNGELAALENYINSLREVTNSKIYNGQIFTTGGSTEVAQGADTVGSVTATTLPEPSAQTNSVPRPGTRPNRQAPPASANASPSTPSAIPPPPSATVGSAPAKPTPAVARQETPSAQQAVAQQTPPTTVQKTQGPASSGAVAEQTESFRKDPKLASLMDVKLTSEIQNPRVVVRNGENVQIKIQKETSFSTNTRFVPIPWEDLRTHNETKEVYGAFYNIDELNQTGTSEVYLLPLQSLTYKDEVTGETKPVNATFIKEGARRQTQQTASRTAPPAPRQGRAEETSRAQAPKIPSPPSQRQASALNSRTPGEQHPRGSATPTASKLSTAPKVQEVQGAKVALSECRNHNVINKLGEECVLTEIPNFQLVKEELVDQLNGTSKVQSVLMNSGIIAMDNSSKVCSKLDISYEQYLDDSRAQAKVEEYKNAMTEAHNAIRDKLFAIPISRRSRPFQQEAQSGRETYSCPHKNECRYSYDSYTYPPLPLKEEISLYSDSFAQKLDMKIYGPTENNKYLVRFQRGGSDYMALVVEDNAGRWLSGDVGNIIDQMEKYKKDFPHQDLRSIQNAYSDKRLRDSKEAYFLNLETDSNGRKKKESVRIGAPESSDFMSKVQTNRTFYGISCLQNPLRVSLPGAKVDSGTATAE